MNKNEFLNLRKQLIEKSFNKLNKMQQEAVFYTEGPLLVLAGAGSGKTTVLVSRTANLLKFGSAYNSDYIGFEPREEHMDFLKAQLKNGFDEDSGYENMLRINAPNPWEILVITFTNKAANELKERLQKMLGKKAMDIWAATFHSACVRILRRDGHYLGYSSHFTIYDTDDSKKLMKDCQKALNIDDKYLPHKQILAAISSAKDLLISPEEFYNDANNNARQLDIAKAYIQYQKQLKKADAMDFDDIIYFTVKLLQENEEVRKYYQNKFKYIMVDEYQDTNHAQYVLTSLLAEKYKNICVVGDDDQSIYKFRGATIDNILGFESQYKNSKIIRLEQNYRSTQNILDAANEIIKNNERRKGKTLWTSNDKGAGIVVHTAYDETEEARFIANDIIKSTAEGNPFGSHAVLYRLNALSNSIESAFVRSGVPYRIIGGHRFYDRKEIRDCLAYLTVINNPSDDIRLKRIINEPKRGIGNTTINAIASIADGLGISMFDVISEAENYEALARSRVKLTDFANMMRILINARDTLPIPELFNLMLTKSGYMTGLETDKETYAERAANINELMANIQRHFEELPDATLNSFLEEVALMSDIDNYNTQADTVVLMTIHSAKGLEFPSVYICGMEQGVFPSQQSMFSISDYEEERRLAYVGVTRAKQKLTLIKSKSRMLFGHTTYNMPSKFIDEIPESLIERSGEYEKKTQAGIQYQRQQDFQKPRQKPAFDLNNFSKPAQKADTALYKTGTEVIHKKFGKGKILSAMPTGNDMLLEIAFEGSGTKKIMANYANLEICE